MKRFSTVFLSLFLLFAAGARAATRLIDRSVVTVNDDVILESDISRFMAKAKSKSFQELFGGIDPKSLNDRNAVLQILIEEKIIDQQVKKLDLKASDQEVDGQIRSILKRNGITEDQLRDRLKQLGTSMEDYRDGIKRQLERHNLVDREIKPNLEITDEEIRHYYLRHGGTENGEMQYKIAHILVSGTGKASAAKADKIFSVVSKDPAMFDKDVKDYSDDSTTLDSGGLLGIYSLSSLSQELRQIVPRTAPGTITKPIKMEDGYHIVKVLEAKPGDFSTLPKDKKEALRNEMISSELEKRMAMWLERKKSEAHIQMADGAPAPGAPSPAASTVAPPSPKSPE
jgi:parvulin-like peptidyl-prolyl isomerase